MCYLFTLMQSSDDIVSIKEVSYLKEEMFYDD